MGNRTFGGTKAEMKEIKASKKQLGHLKEMKNQRICITGQTWNKESYGLFDYESKSESLMKKSFVLSKPGAIQRSGNNLFLANMNASSMETQERECKGFGDHPGEADQRDAETIARLKYNNGSFYICPGHMVDDLNKEENAQKISDPINMWIVTKGYKEGYPLVEGDVIKLGRMKYRIKEIRNPNIPQEHFQPKKAELEVLQQSVFKSSSNEINFESRDESPNSPKESERSTSKPQNTCRICYEPETDCSDPLANICSCAGSMKFIHVSCLQKCFQNRVTTKINGPSASYSWKSFNCEICTTTFPTFFTINNQQYETLPFKRPECFILVESFWKESDGVNSVHIFDMSLKTVIKIGRSHESDLKVADISVSRLHSLIKFSKEKCIIEDKSSKFGTLVLARKGIRLGVSDQSAQVQIGRTFMDCKCILRKPKRKPGCFGVHTDSSDEAIDDINDE